MRGAKNPSEGNLPVFVQFIHRLTLFAFTAHAVLGCCWHHSHSIGNDCCAEHVELVADNCNSTHDCHSHHEHRDESGAQSDCDHDVAAIQAICSDGPDQHSHDCDEGRCSYVAAKLQLLDLDLKSGFVERVCSDTNQFAVASGFSSGRFSDHPVFARAVSSAQRCASLQSWQI